MIQVAILTNEQFELINSFQLGSDRQFFPIKDLNDNYFLTQNDIVLLRDYFDFVNTLELTEYQPKIIESPFL
jgi:hypothetical protein